MTDSSAEEQRKQRTERGNQKSELKRRKTKSNHEERPGGIKRKQTSNHKGHTSAPLSAGFESRRKGKEILRGGRRI